MKKVSLLPWIHKTTQSPFFFHFLIECWAPGHRGPLGTGLTDNAALSRTNLFLRLAPPICLHTNFRRRDHIGDLLIFKLKRKAACANCFSCVCWGRKNNLHVPRNKNKTEPGTNVRQLFIYWLQHRERSICVSENHNKIVRGMGWKCATTRTELDMENGRFSPPPAPVSRFDHRRVRSFNQHPVFILDKGLGDLVGFTHSNAPEVIAPPSDCKNKGYLFIFQITSSASC